MGCKMNQTSSFIYNSAFAAFISAAIVLNVTYICITLIEVYDPKATVKTRPSPPADTIINGTRLITRQAWDADIPQESVKALKLSPAPFVVIHHSATKQCFTDSDCKLAVKDIQYYHIKEKKWSDIGYNFLIGNDGNIYEGRGWNKESAIAEPYNIQSISICIIGDYQENAVNQTLLEKVQDIIEYGVDINKITKNYQVIAHNQAENTTCPGQKIHEIIKNWDHFNSNPTPVCEK